MNVLQAVEKLEDLKEQITAMNVAINQLESDKERYYEVRLLNDIKSEIQKKHNNLKHQLESTPLTTMRDINVIGAEFSKRDRVAATRK